MSDDALDKKHDASSRRLEDLRKRGQTMRSKDLPGGIIIVVSCGVLVFAANTAYHAFINIFFTCVNLMKHIMEYPEFPTYIIREIASQVFAGLMPFFLMTFVLAILSPFVFGRWNFSLEALNLKWENLNPGKYFDRMLSKKVFINVGRSFMKFAIILIFLLVFIYIEFPEIRDLSSEDSFAVFYDALVIMKNFIFVGCFGVLVVVSIDIISSYYEFLENVKMTSEEVKQENKETEGNIFVKRKMRSMQYAMVKQRLEALVPKATVIITNPTHYAVAIRYEAGRDRAPKVLVKAKGFLATQIRKMAIAHAIPIYEAPPLARAVYHTSKMGAEVKPELYMSVAIVLAYINQLSRYQYGLGQLPQPIDDFKIPKEFIFNE